MSMQTEALVPAKQLADSNQAHYPNETAEYRAARMRCWLKKSNCGDTLSVSQPSEKTSLQAVRSRKTSHSSPKRGQFAFLICLAIRTH